MPLPWEPFRVRLGTYRKLTSSRHASAKLQTWMASPAFAWESRYSTNSS